MSSLLSFLMEMHRLQKQSEPHHGYEFIPHLLTVISLRGPVCVCLSVCVCVCGGGVLMLPDRARPRETCPEVRSEHELLSASQGRFNVKGAFHHKI